MSRATTARRHGDTAERGEFEYTDHGLVSAAKRSDLETVIGRCTVCRRDSGNESALCASCHERLRNPPGLCLEHVCALGEPTRPTRTALVDGWGRPHFLSGDLLVGRNPPGGLAVLEGSISRTHARLSCEDDIWRVHDLRSRNGTTVCGTSVQGSAPLESEDIVRFGDVAFYFIESSHLDSVEIPTETRRAHHGAGRELPPLRITLDASPLGGGGIVTIETLRLELSLIQFSLLATLVERMKADAEKPESVRGFVSSGELLTSLPWDTPDPSDNNLKQLVRRVRRATELTGFDELIEGRRGVGYRLRATPQ